MHPNLLHCPLLFLFISVLTSINIHSSLSATANDIRYLNCSQSFTCGNIQNIMYPFWGANRADYCGLPGLELDCENNIPTITMASEKYRILQINTQQRAITVARDDLWNGMCPAGLVNTTLNFELFHYGFGLRNLTLFYGCNFPSGNVPWLQVSIIAALMVLMSAFTVCRGVLRMDRTIRTAMALLLFHFLKAMLRRSMPI